MYKKTVKFQRSRINKMSAKLDANAPSKAKRDRKKVECKSCERMVRPKLSQSGPHLRADCPVCGKYIKFVKK